MVVQVVKAMEHMSLVGEVHRSIPEVCNLYFRCGLIKLTQIYHKSLENLSTLFYGISFIKLFNWSFYLIYQLWIFYLNRPLLNQRPLFLSNKFGVKNTFMNRTEPCLKIWSSERSFTLSFDSRFRFLPCFLIHEFCCIHCLSLQTLHLFF